LEYQKLLEDNLAEELADSMRVGGFSADIIKLSDLHKRIEEEVAENARHFTF
jgi:hypothetical protein